MDEQIEEQTNAGAEQVELRPSVELERQGLIYSSVAERGRGLTLAAEEWLAAREFEIQRTRLRMDTHQAGDREERTRAVVEERNEQRRRDFQRRAGCVNRWADPGRS